MKCAQAIVAAVLAISLSGCLGGKKPVAKAVPAAPKPEPPPPPAPLPEPISIPQTNVQLPAPQPISPEALATTVPHEEPTSPAAPVRVSPRRSTATAPLPAAPKPDTVAPPPTPAPVPPAVDATHLQENLEPAESKRLQDSAESRRQEATQLADKAQSGHLSGAQKSFVARIRSFVRQSEAAQKRGDMRQAFELANRALVLAKELQP